MLDNLKVSVRASMAFEGLRVEGKGSSFSVQGSSLRGWAEMG